MPPSKRKLVRRGISTGLPTKAVRRGHVWTWAFISDATVRGGPLKLLTILDEFTRECHMLRPERALRAADVLTWLERAIKAHAAPAYLRSDDGPEFIAHEVQRWLAEKQIRTIYIDPGSPWQNGFVESFHARFRDECLNQEQPWTLTEARVVIEDFRRHYNERRPHSKLGYQSPFCFAACFIHLPRLRSSRLDKTTQPNYNQISLRTNFLPSSEKGVSSGLLAGKIGQGTAVRSMSFTKHYLHDVFISYASANNVPPGHGYPGLIDEFRHRLAVELGGLGIGQGLDIFFDKRGIDDHTPLTEQVLSAARASAVMVAFHSPAFDQSIDWCHREFREWQGLNNQGRDRLFVVSLNKDEPPTRSAVFVGADVHFREFFYDLGERWYRFDTDALAKPNRFELNFNAEVFGLAQQIKIILLRLQTQSPNKRVFLTCNSGQQKAALADLQSALLAQGYHVLRTSPWIVDPERRRLDAENLIALVDLVAGVEEKLDLSQDTGVHAAEQLEIAGRLRKPQLRWLPGQGHGFSDDDVKQRKSRAEVKAGSMRDFKQLIIDQLTPWTSSATTVPPPTATVAIPADTMETAPRKASTFALIVHSESDRDRAPGDMAGKLRARGAGSDRMEDTHSLRSLRGLSTWQKAMRRAIKGARADKVIILHGSNPREWIDARLRNYEVIAGDLQPNPPTALCEYPPLPKNHEMAREYEPTPGTIDVFRHDDLQALAAFVSK